MIVWIGTISPVTMMVKQHSLLYPGDFGKLGKFRKLEKENGS
jgi:hypothetical protein